jgi:hypothetical protein
MHGIERAERRRERVARSTQHGGSQQDQVDGFKPFADDLQPFSGFLNCE